MNAFEVLYWVRVYAGPGLVLGGVLLAVGVVGIVRHRRGGVTR